MPKKGLSETGPPHKFCDLKQSIRIIIYCIMATNNLTTFYSVQKLTSKITNVTEKNIEAISIPHSQFIRNAKSRVLAIDP